MFGFPDLAGREAGTLLNRPSRLVKIASYAQYICKVQVQSPVTAANPKIVLKVWFQDLSHSFLTYWVLLLHAHIITRATELVRSRITFSYCSFILVFFSDWRLQGFTPEHFMYKHKFNHLNVRYLAICVGIYLQDWDAHWSGYCSGMHWALTEGVRQSRRVGFWECDCSRETRWSTHPSPRNARS